MGSASGVTRYASARDKLLRKIAEAEAELSSAKAGYHQATFLGQRETALERIRVADRKLGELKDEYKVNEEKLEQAREAQQQEELSRQEKALTFQAVRQESPKTRDDAAKTLSKVLTFAGAALLTGLVSTGVLKGELGQDAVPYALRAARILIFEIAAGFAFPFVKFLVEDARYRKSRDKPEDIAAWEQGHRMLGKRDIGALWFFFLLQAILMIIAVVMVLMALRHVNPSLLEDGNSSLPS